MKYAIIWDEQVSNYSGYEEPGEFVGTSTMKVFREYKSKEDWERAIIQETTKKYGSSSKFRAICFTDAEVTTKVEVKITEI